MAWTVYQSLIAVMMVITGSINTISTKWADKTLSAGRDGKVHEFNHPFFQSAGMFLGEMTCLVAFSLILFYYRNIKKVDESNLPDIVVSDSFNGLIFFVPALLDMTATTTMYIGLTMTFASSFQMLRGALIVFTGILTVTVLKRSLKGFQWLGIIFIIIGLAVVGSNDFFKKEESANEGKGTGKMITGDILIILAQILTAFQMIVEEKFLRGKNIPPLKAVGYEGLFGLIIASLLIIPLSFIKITQDDGTSAPIEDPLDAFLQIKNNWQTALAIFGNIVSIAFFNFAGISVTKEISATTRTVLDSVRTLIIWLFSLAIGWEKFAYLQLIGFVLLVIGMFVYNDVIFRPMLIKNGILKSDDDRYNMIHTDERRAEPEAATIEDKD